MNKIHDHCRILVIYFIVVHSSIPQRTNLHCFLSILKQWKARQAKGQPSCVVRMHMTRNYYHSFLPAFQIHCTETEP